MKVLFVPTYTDGISKPRVYASFSTRIHGPFLDTHIWVLITHICALVVTHILVYTRYKWPYIWDKSPCITDVTSIRGKNIHVYHVIILKRMANHSKTGSRISHYSLLPWPTSSIFHCLQFPKALSTRRISYRNGWPGSRARYPHQ